MSGLIEHTVLLGHKPNATKYKTEVKIYQSFLPHWMAAGNKQID